MDLSLPLAAELAQARTQMAFTLGFHIILASIGVAFPAMMLIANYRGLRKNDPVALRLAERWSKVAAVTFAVGAVTGTVLVVRVRPAVAGVHWTASARCSGSCSRSRAIFFFLEAIFIAIYIFGWKRLSGWAHFWTGVPIVIAGLGGAFSVVAVNSWMNQPQGYTLDANGKVTDVDPLKVIFNPAVPYEVPHMILAAYLVDGVPGRVGVRGRDAARAARPPPPPRPADPADGRRDRDADPVRGRRHRGARDRRGPADQVRRDGVRAGDRRRTSPEYIYGRCTSEGVKGGIGIPGLDSFLVGWSTDTEVTGLDTVPPDDRPPANTMLHWAFDTMVGICTALIGLGLWLGYRMVAQARHPEDAVVPARRRGLRGGWRSSPSSAAGS